MKRNKRRLGPLVAVLATVVVAPLLSGCWGVASMEQTGLVALMGIDTAPGNEYLVTIAVTNPLGLPTPTGGAPGGPPELVRSAVGSSIADAVRSLVATTYLQLDFTHMRGIVVSQAVARLGLAAPLELMARSRQFEETPMLYVARGESASAILTKSQEMMPDAGAVLAGTMVWAQHLFPGYADRVFSFLDQMQTEGDEPATAGVSVASSQGHGPTLAFRLTGTAMFRSDRLVGWLDRPQSLGWLVATGRAKQQILVAPARNGGTFTLEIRGDRRRVRITQTPTGPHADIRVDVLAQLMSADRAPAAFWASPAALAAARAGVASVLTSDIRSALEGAQSAGSDIFSLGEYVRLQDPAEWYRLKGNWNTSAFPHMPVAIQVLVTISSVGKQFCPIVQPC